MTSATLTQSATDHRIAARKQLITDVMSLLSANPYGTYTKVRLGYMANSCLGRRLFTPGKETLCGMDVVEDEHSPFSISIGPSASETVTW